jgi:hypothetical protein
VLEPLPHAGAVSRPRCCVPRAAPPDAWRSRRERAVPSCGLPGRAAPVLARAAPATGRQLATAAHRRAILPGLNTSAGVRRFRNLCLDGTGFWVRSGPIYCANAPTAGRAWLGETTLAATTPGRGHRFARPIICTRRLRNGFLTEDERGAFIAHPPAPAYHQHPLHLCYPLFRPSNIAATESGCRNIRLITENVALATNTVSYGFPKSESLLSLTAKQSPSHSKKSARLTLAR